MWRILIWVISVIATTDTFAQWEIFQRNEINPIISGRNSHSSTILELKSGKLIASWFEGTHESHPDVSIYISFYSENLWGKPIKIADGNMGEGHTYPCWNPVLYQNSKGRIFILYKVGPNPRSWWGMKTYSDDDGKSWSVPEKLPDGFLGPTKNKPIILKNGLILHPSSTESKDETTWHIHFETSDDNMCNWKKIWVNNGDYGLIQPTLIRHQNGKIQALMRSRQNQVISLSSENEGITWSQPMPVNLPNPNAAIDAISLPDGSFLMVYNPMRAGNNWWEGRNVLKLAQSSDGENWNEMLEVENQEKGEFSYPAIIISKSGEIHITYTNDRKNIKHVVLRNK